MHAQWSDNQAADRDEMAEEYDVTAADDDDTVAGTEGTKEKAPLKFRAERR